MGFNKGALVKIQGEGEESFGVVSSKTTRGNPFTFVRDFSRVSIPVPVSNQKLKKTNLSQANEQIVADNMDFLQSKGLFDLLH
ncbi:MAG: hypothetical protein K9G62_01710 [Alphaproteobacteria bacterium]|nr:hypothetical protein [Alphaproteobacteria bacterium]